MAKWGLTNISHPPPAPAPIHLYSSLFSVFCFCFSNSDESDPRQKHSKSNRNTKLQSDGRAAIASWQKHPHNADFTFCHIISPSLSLSPPSPRHAPSRNSWIRSSFIFLFLRQSVLRREREVLKDGVQINHIISFTYEIWLSKTAVKDEREREKGGKKASIPP